jgi:AraC-like DNA-binding protein
MSFHAVTEPLTTRGVQLGERLELITPRFHIHECGFMPELYGWKAQRILCPFWRLWYIIGEDYWMESNGVRRKLGAEHIVFVPPQLICSTGSSGPASHLWLHFSLIPDYAFEDGEAFDVPMDALLREQVKALICAHRALHSAADSTLYHHAAALLHNCFTHHPLPLRALPEALRSILHEIENMPASDLSNARLAHCANMSMGNFVRWFKEHMHQSPAFYVRQTRLKKASWMLLFSDLSIGQIAATVGFSNRDYFSRVFINHAGCGPATFRKNYDSLPRK